MMCTHRIVVSLALLFTVLFAHGQDFVEQKAFRFYENSQIEQRKREEQLRGFKIIAGDQLVFEFSSNNSGDPGNHSKVPTKLVFQIDQNKQKFILKDEEITEHLGAYAHYARTQDRGAHEVAKGTVKGKRNADNSWSIELDVIVVGWRTGKTYHLQESAVFKGAERE